MAGDGVGGLDMDSFFGREKTSLYHTRISSRSLMITRTSVPGNYSSYCVPNRAILGGLSLQLTKSSLTSTDYQFLTTIKKINNRALFHCEKASNKALLRAVYMYFLWFLGDGFWVVVFMW